MRAFLKRCSRRRADAVPRGIYQGTPLYMARAEGAVLEDVDGNRYIDFAGGIGCQNIGHRSPGVLEAVRAQLDRYMHTCFQVLPYEGYVRLAERLNQLAPGNFPKKTFFVNSGAEAIENAVKIARSYTKRPAIICFEDAFHGRTMMTLSLTSKTHPYKEGFEPFDQVGLGQHQVDGKADFEPVVQLRQPSADLAAMRLDGFLAFREHIDR